MLKRKSILSLLIVLFSVNIFAQTSLKGIIKTETGETLVGASILVKGTKLGTVSDSNGNFEFANIRKGKQILSISFIGYISNLVEVKIPSTQVITIVLKESNTISEEIIVKATRADNKTPFAFSTLDKEDIKANNTGEDIPYLLSLQPSIVTTSETGTGFGYTGMRIRGSDASRINITINGIPFNDSESHGVYWVNMPDFANSVSSVQVQRGVGTSTNGAGAFGASVNFKTESIRQEAFAEVNANYGSFNTLKASIKAGSGLINNKFAFDIRLSQMNSDGFVRNAFSEHNSFALNAAYVTDKSILKASIISGNQRTGITWWGNPKEMLETDREYNPAGEYTDYYGNTRFYEDQTDNYIQTHYQLHFSKQINSSLNFTAALHYTRGDGFYEQYKEDDLFSDYGLQNIDIEGTSILIDDKVFDFPDGTITESDFIRRKMMANDFYGSVFSLNYSNEKLNFSFGTAINKYDGDHFGNVLWTQWAGDYTKDYEWYFNNGTKIEFNSFAKANYSISKMLNIYADIQYRFIDYQMTGIDDDLNNLEQTHQFNFVNPKTGLFVQLNDNQSIYASFALANREPSRANFKDANGDDAATPQAETLMDYEAGYSFSSSIFTTSLNAYYMDYRDQLVPTGEKSNSGYDIMTNVEASYRMGIELSSAIKPADFLQWNVSLTFSKNKIQNFIEYSDYYDASWEYLGNNAKELGETDIAYSPNIIASSKLTVTALNNLDISLISKYVGEQFFDNTSNENRKLDAYFINNALISYHFSTKNIENISIRFQVNNLLNVEYSNNAYGGNYYADGEELTWSYYFPQAGTNFLMGINFSF